MPYATNPHDGVRIHFEVEGNGPPLMLHVGFLGRLQDWQRVGMVDALRDEYQLILIDPRGQGKSNKPHDVEAYGLQRYVDDVVAVLDTHNIERAHFLGYSMGAQIGYAAGIFAPDRFLSLILGGSHPYFDQPPTALMPTVREEAELLSQGMEAFVDRFEARFGSLSAEVRDNWLDNDGEALAANTLALETFPDISGQLAEILVPTLIYCGTEDDTFPEARRASQAIPNARFLSVGGMNHTQAFRQSDRVLPHIRAFLAEVGVPA